MARARFRVVRVNRWTVALFILAVLALILLPTDGSRPAGGASQIVIQQGVTILNRDFSGKTETEARLMLEELGSAFASSPIDAREGRASDGISYVIPELNGYRLDVDLTWFRLAMAPEGSRVEPAARMLPAARRLNDFPQSVIQRGNGEKRAVALLINVDWGEKELSVQMLPTLKKYGIKSTFFVSGRWAEQHERLLQTIAADGHEIATHGHDLRFGPADLAQRGLLASDIKRSVEAIQRITGTPVRYFAPHKSEVSEEIVRTAADLQLRTVLYSIDTVDWDPQTSPEMVLSRIRRAKAGDLILMHPKANTAQVLEQALLQFQGQGLRPVTLSELLSPEPDTPAEAWARRYE